MTIRKQHLPSGTKRRPGTKNGGVKFLVIHDTGNPGSEKYGPATAQRHAEYYALTANDETASAHLFVDDKEVIECIPQDEIAYHVMYDKPTDNFIYGCDANSNALGLEMCYGLDIDAVKSYWNLVALTAQLCNHYALVELQVTAHTILDPTRKTDPLVAFTAAGKNWMEFLEDVKLFRTR